MSIIFLHEKIKLTYSRKGSVSSVRTSKNILFALPFELYCRCDSPVPDLSFMYPPPYRWVDKGEVRNWTTDVMANLIRKTNK